jgi:arginase
LAKTSNRKVGILGVPLGYGAGKTGSELGVTAMRLSNVRGRTLREHIEHLGYEVTDHGDAEIVKPEDLLALGNPRFLKEMLASCDTICPKIGEMLAADEIPVILGGDHAIAIPTFSAIAAQRRDSGAGEVGLIWFDAHADINTPQTAPSGNIHGMPLAVLLGEGDESLVNINGFAPKLDPKFFAHIGLRDPDDGEREMIRKLDLRDHFFTMSDIDDRGMAACVADAIAIAGKAPGGYAVTFDIDSMDPTFAPGSGTLVRGGLTYREAHLALETIAEDGGLISFEMVEVNPLLDQSNITVELACELILSALGKTIL